MIFSLVLVLPLMAQTSIEKLVSEIESKGVDGTVIVKRNSSTKKIIKKTRCYNFISKNGNYAQKFVRAFKENSDNAVNYVQSRNNYVAKFINGNMVTTYILNIQGGQSRNPRVSLVITAKDQRYKSEILIPGTGWSMQLSPEDEEELEEDVRNLEDQLADVGTDK